MNKKMNQNCPENLKILLTLVLIHQSRVSLIFEIMPIGIKAS